MEDDRYTRITLRVPKDLLAQVTDAATATSKSQNAEIVGRLRASFESQGAALPFAVQQAIDNEIEERGGSAEDALTRLVLAGQSQGGTVLYASINPRTTLKQFRDMLNATRADIPPDAALVFERKSTQRASKK